MNNSYLKLAGRRERSRPFYFWARKLKVLPRFMRPSIHRLLNLFQQGLVSFHPPNRPSAAPREEGVRSMRTDLAPSGVNRNGFRKGIELDSRLLQRRSKGPMSL
jgi:hypothetical protein